MSRAKNPNLQILNHAVERLGDLADDMVFLGGCVTGLLTTDPAAPPIRVTRDVDAIVDVISKPEFYRLSEKLREQGFSEDMREDAPICRWIADDIRLDVMPADRAILGFGNRWYAPAMKNAKSVEISSGHSIRIVTGPFFLAIKLDAFAGRGGGDYLASHDMEDIVTILDGRVEIAEEARQAHPGLRH
jgi:hypothetical protein